MQTAKTTALTLRPQPSDDRPETAPLLPSEFILHLDGTVTGQHVDYEDERFRSFGEAVRAYQASATELLGEALDHDRIRQLRAAAGNAWDPETIADCDAALEGDEQARERVADHILDAMVAAAID